ncbi:MAG: NirA family protein [Verrucomicrobiales bacterium]
MSTNTPNRIAGKEISPSQKNWLDGFFAGFKNQGISFSDAVSNSKNDPKKQKLIAEEKIKKTKNPFNAFSSLIKLAKRNLGPEKDDAFRFKWNGLFWLAPIHEGYMCRLRIPGGMINSNQLIELASISEDLAWGYLQITTRNNFQIRVIEPKDTPTLLRRIQDCGLHSRGAGADNLRNFTSNPTAGIDPYELIDVSPLINELAHTVINQPEFYDLPRKFNVSLDGGGIVGVAEDTNDIGLRAIRLKDPPKGHPLHGKVKGGVWFRLLMGGVTGHKEFAEDCGAICRPEDAVEIITALVKVYIQNGNRGNRGKARLVYLIKEWGNEKYIGKAQELLDGQLVNFDFSDPLFSELIENHEKPLIPHAHVGDHQQLQEGLSWLGVYIPVGILQSKEARLIAEVAKEFGTGDLRLTIFQNIIIPNIPRDRINAAREKLADGGLATEISLIKGGTVACTGNQHCKFSSSDTKSHATEIVQYLDNRITLDKPINIHVTGCPHSCAQHYIGDIGLLACKVSLNKKDDPVEGYHIFIGGGFGPDKSRIGRQIFKSIPAGNSINQTIHAMLIAYLSKRKDKESFFEFTSRHNVDYLEKITNQILAETDSFAA